MTETGVQIQAPQQKLKGKSFMLKGTFTWGFEVVKACIVKLGGTVTDSVSPDLSYLVAEGRGSGDAKKQAEKLNKAGAAISIISESDLCDLLAPSREEALAMLSSGPEGWAIWNSIVQTSGMRVDLQTAVLNDIDLGNAVLYSTNLTGADLGGCTLANAHFGRIRSVDFSRCQLSQVAIERADRCTFIGTRFNSVNRVHLSACDLSHADFTETLAPAMIAHDCNFTGAYFISAKMINVSLRTSNLANAVASYSDWSGASLLQAKLNGADFSNAVLDGANLGLADLSAANFSNASLVGAQLNGATVKGANFEGACLSGADLTGVDIAGADKLVPTPAWQPPSGTPAMAELDQLATIMKPGVYQTQIELTVDMGGRHVKLWVQWNNYHRFAHSGLLAESGLQVELGKDAKCSEALGRLARLYHVGKLDQSSIKCDSNPDIVPQVMVACCEAFGVEGRPIAELEKEVQERRKAYRETMQEWLRSGSEGVVNWNKKAGRMIADGANVTKMNLSKCEIEGADFRYKDLGGSNFQGAKLTNVKADSAVLSKSDFSNSTIEGLALNGANMKECDFSNAKLTKCCVFGTAFARVKFAGTLLEQCSFAGSDFKNCDLRGATINNCDFSRVQFNEETHFPAGFELKDNMVWAGKGKSPLIEKTLEQAAAAGPVDFAGFMKNLEDSVEKDRLKKAVKMLKTEKFQLFADVKDDSVVGIVKSQTDADLVYSCRLTSDGIYACCSQNLNPCGGLRGALCKHLLVLIVGLSKQAELDTTAVNAWVKASQLQKPQLDKDIMSETLLRYKGAEAGEIDWRPTETLPEDYYAI